MIWIPLTAISPHLKNAILTAEINFYHHHGLDLYAIKLAMEENWEEKALFRSSTITQLVKIYIYPHLKIRCANGMKQFYVTSRTVRFKKQALEIYLNVIE